MQQVKVNKNDLIAVVKKNLETHDAIYADAVNGFWDRAKASLQDRIAELEDKKPQNVYVSIPFPVSHGKEYVKALRQLDMSVENEITLSEGEFNQLVMNEWSWKAAFTSSNMQYLTSAVSSGMAMNF